MLCIIKRCEYVGVINIKNNANVSKVLCYRPKDVIVEHEKGE